MYTQQEYELVRRQTLQMEAEKRVLLRLTLVATVLLFAGSLMVIGWMYRQYSSAESRVATARDETARYRTELEMVRSELQEKVAILTRDASSRQQVETTINSLLPRVVAGTARDFEIAELAHAVYQKPGHMVQLPSKAPDIIHQGKYRLRIENRPHSYILIIGLLDGKWVLYSNLVKNQEDFTG